MSVDLLPAYRTHLERDVAAGLSDPAIADKLGVSERTVLRWRGRLGLESQWSPATAPHGTTARYRRCKCDECRAANNRAHVDYMSRKRDERPAPNAYAPWSQDDELVLLDDTRGSITVRAALVGRTYGACIERLRLIRLRTT